MAQGRPSATITLTLVEHEKLTLMSRRPKTSQRDALRARIVLDCAAGLSGQQIAARQKTSAQTVSKWRRRFAAHRLEGLIDAPRSGPPRRLDDRKIEEAVTRTLETVPTARTHWSSRLLAKEMGISSHSVQRIWRAFGLKPHRQETFKLSTDPMFVEKVRDVVGLYLNPPEKAIVLCVDEKSQTQALERTQPLLPMKPHQAERRTHDYERHGTLSLFAAYDAATGRVLSHAHKRHRHQEFIAFLERIDEHWPDDGQAQLHLVMDNYGTHKAPRVKRWLARHPRFHVHFTPTGSSWMNLVERFFAKITTEAIRRASFRHLGELRAAINAYVDEHNKNPKPFVWTASPEKIFEKLRYAIS